MCLFCLAGWQLLLWRWSDGVRRVYTGIHPEHPVHHPRLRHQHKEFKEEGPNVWCWSSWKLFTGRLWNGNLTSVWEYWPDMRPRTLDFNYLQTLERHFTSYIITYYLPSGLCGHESSTLHLLCFRAVRGGLLDFFLDSPRHRTWQVIFRILNCLSTNTGLLSIEWLFWSHSFLSSSTSSTT